MTELGLRTEPNRRLKETIVTHCRWIASFDREYAIWTFNQYAERMPWLELRGK